MRRDKKGRILREPQIGKICLVCGGIFFVHICLQKQKFCSHKCKGKFFSGKLNYFYERKIIRTPEIIQRIKEKMSGANNPNWQGGEYFKNKCENCNQEFFTYPSQARRFCSKKCLGNWQSETRKGKNHPNWKGGLTSDILKRLASREWKAIREEIFRRDNYTCQKCRQKNLPLDVHHIIPFQYSKCDECFNLITLCDSCHGKEEFLFEKENEELYLLLNQWKAIKQEFPEYKMELFE